VAHSAEAAVNDPAPPPVPTVRSVAIDRRTVEFTPISNLSVNPVGGVWATSVEVPDTAIMVAAARLCAKAGFVPLPVLVEFHGATRSTAPVFLTIPPTAVTFEEKVKV